MRNILNNLLLVVFPVILIQGCKQPLENEAARGVVTDWKRIGPGGGGSTFIPTFSYHSPDTYLIRCDMTGSYLTRNGGDSYELINMDGGAASFAFDPLDSATIYIGATGLNRSEDGGRSWKMLYPAANEIQKVEYTGDHAEYSMTVKTGSKYVQEIGRIENVKADPLASGTIYFSMGKAFFYSYDDGLHWDRIDLDQPVSYIYTNSFLAKKSVYVFTKDKVNVFDKQSSKFSSHAFPASMVPVRTFSAGLKKNSEETILYALKDEKNYPWDFSPTSIWISTDLGLHWTQASDAIIANSAEGVLPSYTSINCAELDAAQVYVVANQYAGKSVAGKGINWYGTLKSSDGGKNWNWIWKGGGGSGAYGIKDATDAANLKDAWVHAAFGGEFIQLFDVGVSPQNGSNAIITDWYRVMKTSDGGSSWQEAYSKTVNDSSYVSRGMDVTTTYGVHFDPFDSSHLAISYTDIGYHHSFDGGKSWQRSVKGVPGEWVNTCYWVAFDPSVKNKLWSAWSGLHDFPRGKMTRNPQWKTAGRGGICVSVDGGRSWSPTVDGMGNNSPATSIVLDTNSVAGNRVLYATVFSKGVFKSTDDGKSWRLMNKGLDSNTCAFEITLTSNGSLYLVVSATPMHKGGVKGPGYYSGAVYRSIDGAESWEKLKIAPEIFPSGIEVDPAHPNRLYLGCWGKISLSDLVGGDIAKANGGNKTLEFPGGIFMSEDAGNSWKQILNKEQYVYDVTVDPYHPGRLYCNTFNKVAWRSDDYGNNWKNIAGYDFHWGHRVVPDPVDHEKVYLTTYGSSVWHGTPAVSEKD